MLKNFNSMMLILILISGALVHPVSNEKCKNYNWKDVSKALGRNFIDGTVTGSTIIPAVTLGPVALEGGVGIFNLAGMIYLKPLLGLAIPLTIPATLLIQKASKKFDRTFPVMLAENAAKNKYKSYMQAAQITGVATGLGVSGAGAYYTGKLIHQGVRWGYKFIKK
jgi:hypothetical protein